MMLKLVVFVFLLTVCCAQEHLTCLRTDEILAPQCSPTPSRLVQGPPGKRGPKGQEGSNGSKGQKGQEGSMGSKGQKGEIGTPDNYHQIKVLQKQLKSISQEMAALKNQTTNNFKAFSDVATNVLLLPPNGYAYKLILSRQSWQASQNICHNWGGDLAVHGIKTLGHRLKLIKNLPINDRFWIGVNDVASEGNWTWVNGEPASSAELIWSTGEPNNGGGRGQDCVSVYVNQTQPDGSTDDTQCWTAFLGLCEKKILDL